MHYSTVTIGNFESSQRAEQFAMLALEAVNVENAAIEPSGDEWIVTIVIATKHIDDTTPGAS